MLNISSCYTRKSLKIPSYWQMNRETGPQTFLKAQIAVPDSWNPKSWRLVLYIWVIDPEWGKSGCILAKFFFACLWTETESKSINSQKETSETISDSAECSMHSSHAELITPFLYNPCRSLLVCIDLGSQLGILMRHKLSSVYVLWVYFH